ncbi:MAG: hypothetical protein PVI43_00475 [Candidatus Bathyarchaeota archaeon]|jgi:hypothetical protein
MSLETLKIAALMVSHDELQFLKTLPHYSSEGSPDKIFIESEVLADHMDDIRNHCILEMTNHYELSSLAAHYPLIGFYFD